MKKRVLILGADGMVGKTVYTYLKNIRGDSISASSRKNKNFINLDATNTRSLKKLLKNYTHIINCVGINNVSKKNLKEAKLINSIFPKKLDNLSIELNFKLIHISSDAVFDRESGKKTEIDKPNPKDLYGISKLKGETLSKNSITVRTSILGINPDKKSGLLEWFLSSENEIEGYQNQLWSGCTALQFAKLCDDIIYNNLFKKLRQKSNFFHFCPLGPTSKYEILLSFKKIVNKKISIKKINSKSLTTRYLASFYFDNKFFKAYTTNLSRALKELVELEKIYEK